MTERITCAQQRQRSRLFCPPCSRTRCSASGNLLSGDMIIPREWFCVLCPVLFWSARLSCPLFPCTSGPCDCLSCPWLFPPVSNHLHLCPITCTCVQSPATVSNHLHLPCVSKPCLSRSPVLDCTVWFLCVWPLIFRKKIKVSVERCWCLGPLSLTLSLSGYNSRDGD